MKRRNGEHIGSFAPYGYKKSPEDNNALIIDEEAADVVRDIFRMFLNGMGKNGIVHFLNDHGVLSPGRYKQERQGLKYRNPSTDPKMPTLWCAGTVSNILKNRMYCGDMVQGRYRIKSYKIHIQERVPEDEWYIVENTHEAIIDRETFDKVQQLLRRDVRTAPNQQKLYLFSGFLRCADCGSASAAAVLVPDFTLKDQNGKTHSLSDYQSQVVFLNSWANWCGPCRQGTETAPKR